MAKNVREQIILTDTILISKWVGRMSNRPTGWYTSFNELGRAGVLNFVNVRNRSIPGGVAYNNQDARDQLPFPMRVNTIGVKFFAPAAASLFTACRNMGSTTVDREPYPDSEFDDPPYTQLINREELHCAVWEADVPNNCSFLLRTNQDIRLKSQIAMLGSGYGAVGGGWGWGSPGDLYMAAYNATPTPSISHDPTPPTTGAYASNLETIQHGEADLRKRFPFPIALELPKRANLSIEIKLSPYAREMLQAMTGPYWMHAPRIFGSETGLVSISKAAMFGVHVTIQAERLVQQRADYHA